MADDVLSLEYDTAFRDLWVDGDESIVYDSAQALAAVQNLYGLFPRIVGKGYHASRLQNFLSRESTKVSSESPLDTAVTSPDNFDCLIVLDRRVDMITPLLTQLTYEGLLDETIGIKNSHVELPVSLVSPPAPADPAGSSAAPAQSQNMATTSLRKENRKKYHLTSATDPLFAELRDLNFSSVGRRLSGVAHRLDGDYKTDLQSKTVAQLRDFVGKLGGLQSEHQALRLHTGISELILPVTKTDHFNKSLEIQQNLLASYEVNSQITAIEEMIVQGVEKQTVLRLLCLASITSGGIKAKVLENIKREFLQTYGYHLLPALLVLSSPSLGILLSNPIHPTGSLSASLAKYPFSVLRKSLRLLIEDTQEALDDVENDIGYVYSGYAPISIRLVQCVAQKGGVISNPSGGKGDTANEGIQAHPIVGWKGFEDVMAAIPGDTVDVIQRKADESTQGTSSQTDLKATTTVVFFLGGCTFTEIAALRWVGRQYKGRRFLIATTGIITGSGIMDSVTGTSSTKPAPGTGF